MIYFLKNNMCYIYIYILLNNIEYYYYILLNISVKLLHINK